MQRVEQIRQLKAMGRKNRDIGVVVGLSEDRVRKICSEFKIAKNWNSQLDQIVYLRNLGSSWRKVSEMLDGELSKHTCRRRYLEWEKEITNKRKSA